MKRTVTFLIVLAIFSPIFASAAQSRTIFHSEDCEEKTIALTFDDGPHPRYTKQILDILEKYGVKATFFFVGQNIEYYPEVARAVVDAGHEIGNHTFSHPSVKGLLPQKIDEEIQSTQEIIFEITGQKPKVFRAPGGIYDGAVLDMAEKHGLKPVLWSWRQDTKDWSKPSVDYIVNTVVNNLRDGDIILFHDFNVSPSPTPAALEIILPQLIEKGYSFVTVSELMEMGKEV